MALDGAKDLQMKMTPAERELFLLFGCASNQVNVPLTGYPQATVWPGKLGAQRSGPGEGNKKLPLVRAATKRGPHEC
jgi:hypothetical protein